MTMRPIRAQLLALAALVLAVASCTPDAPPPDDEVDGGAGVDSTMLEHDVACTPEEHVISYPDGSVQKSTRWFAVIEPPFDWRKVHARLCDQQPATPPSQCPAGATCSGVAPTAAACFTTSTVEIVGGPDGPGRIYCGVTGENISAGGITTRTGQRYMRVTVFVAD